MIWITSKITFFEKSCGTNQTQINWLQLLTWSGYSKIASLTMTSISPRPMTRVPNCSWNLELPGKGNDIKLGEVANLMITSVPLIKTLTDSYIPYQTSELVFLCTILLILLIEIIRSHVWPPYLILGTSHYETTTQHCFSKT